MVRQTPNMSRAFKNEGLDVNGATTARDASSFDITPMSHFDLSNGLPKCLRQKNILLFNKQQTLETELFQDSTAG